MKRQFQIAYASLVVMGLVVAGGCSDSFAQGPASFADRQTGPAKVNAQEGEHAHSHEHEGHSHEHDGAPAGGPAEEMLQAGADVGQADAPESGDDASAGGSYGPATEGPHGGRLIFMGGAGYYAELVPEPRSPITSIYILDGAAATPVAIASFDVVIEAELPSGIKRYRIGAAPTEGDPEGAASQYQSTNPQLYELVREQPERLRRLVALIDGRKSVGQIDYPSAPATDIGSLEQRPDDLREQAEPGYGEDYSRNQAPRETRAPRDDVLEVPPPELDDWQEGRPRLSDERDFEPRTDGSHPAVGSRGEIGIAIPNADYHAELVLDHDEFHHLSRVFLVDNRTGTPAAIGAPEIVLNMPTEDGVRRFRLVAEPLRSDPAGASSCFRSNSLRLYHFAVEARDSLSRGTVTVGQEERDDLDPRLPKTFRAEPSGGPDLEEFDGHLEHGHDHSH